MSDEKAVEAVVASIIIRDPDDECYPTWNDVAQRAVKTLRSLGWCAPGEVPEWFSEQCASCQCEERFHEGDRCNVCYDWCPYRPAYRIRPIEQTEGETK